MILKTEVHDGLTFVLPTWDPTPVSWNASGSWFKDPVVEESVLEGIRQAIPNYQELACEASAYKHDPDAPGCGTYWGGHGCDRDAGHVGLCVCGPPDDLCSAGLKYGTGSTFIQWWADDETPCGLRLSFHHWTWFE